MTMSLVHIMLSLITCISLLHLTAMSVKAASEDYQIVSAEIPQRAVIIVEAVKNKIASSPTNTMVWNEFLHEYENILYPNENLKPKGYWYLEHPGAAIAIELLRKARIVDVSGRVQTGLIPDLIRYPFRQPSAMLSNFVGYKQGKVSGSSVDDAILGAMRFHVISTYALINGISSNALEFLSNVHTIYRDFEAIVVDHFLLELAEQHIADHFSPSSGRITELGVGTVQRLINARILIRGPMANAVDYAAKNVRSFIADIMERIDADLKSEIDDVLTKWFPLCIDLMQARRGLVLDDNLLARVAAEAHQFSTEHFWREMMISPSIGALRCRRQSLQNLFHNLIQKELLPLVLSEQQRHKCWLVFLPALTLYLNREIQYTSIVESASVNAGLYTLNLPQLISFLHSFRSTGYNHHIALYPDHDSQFVQDAQQ